MKNPELKIFSTELETAEKLAAAFKSAVDENTTNRKNINIAISGGRTPKALFKILADEYKEKIIWKDIHFFWVDERCVPPEEQESNFGMTKKFLFDNIEIPEENIHRIKGENNPEKEAVRYSALLDKYLNFEKSLPRFDLIILGIGTDGHTASIFPNQLELIKSEKACAVAVHPETGQRRITLTGNVINNGARVVFMITGEDKADVVADIIKKKTGYEKYPSAYIEPVCGAYEWFLDSQAAKFL